MIVTTKLHLTNGAVLLKVYNVEKHIEDAVSMAVLDIEFHFNTQIETVSFEKIELEPIAGKTLTFTQKQVLEAYKEAVVVKATEIYEEKTQ